MSKNERRLSKSELKRKEQFEATAQEYMQQGYTKSSLTISALAVNLYGLIVPLPFLALLCWLFYYFNQTSIFPALDIFSVLIFMLCFFALIVAHEGIHGLSWGIFAKKRLRSISFGIIPQFLTPYCTCNEALTKAQYITGALMPTVILSFIPAVYAIFTGNKIVFCMAVFMLLSGGGDMLITLKLLFHKTKNKSSVYLDHPYDVGLVVFERA